MQRIADGVFLVSGARGGRFPFSHSVLLLDRVRVLIDAGCGAETLSLIQKRHSPDLVLLSHGHPDHCSGGGIFSRNQIWAPRESLESTGRLARMAERFISRPLQDEWMDFMRREIGFREFTPGHAYRGGEAFDLGSLRLLPVHAPGHSRDHYCFHIPEASVMVTTDMDFTRFGPWYANDEGNIDAFLRSIERVRAYDVDTAVSSHEGVLRSRIQERFDRFAAAFEERESRILASLDHPQDLEALVDRAVIYGSFPVRPRILRFWERQMVEKHLDRLIARGCVERRGDTFVRVC